jgi:4,5-dihydroxyphthalate decarboxylase
MTERLTIACGAYDRTWPLIAGRIAPEGYELDWTILPPEQAFLRGQVAGGFDISELSFSTYLVQASRNASRYRAIPVFPSRMFRHSAIYVRANAGIHAPEDLSGKTIGVPEFQLSAIVWARGILSDEHGVAVEDVQWVIADIDQPHRVEKVPVELPARISARHLDPNDTLWAAMQRGEVDAIIAPRAPQAFVEGDPRIVRLFPNAREAERAYYERTGIFPIMHLIGIREDVAIAHPDLPAALLQAFDAARGHARQELHQVAYSYAMLPWLPDLVSEADRTMGGDYWSYGIEKNRKALGTMCRYSFEQGLSERLMTCEEIFIY